MIDYEEREERKWKKGYYPLMLLLERESLPYSFIEGELMKGKVLKGFSDLEGNFMVKENDFYDFIEEEEKI